MAHALKLDLKCLAKHLHEHRRAGNGSVHEARQWLNSTGFQRCKGDWICLNAQLKLINRAAILDRRLIAF